LMRASLATIFPSVYFFFLNSFLARTQEPKKNRTKLVTLKQKAWSTLGRTIYCEPIQFVLLLFILFNMSIEQWRILELLKTHTLTHRPKKKGSYEFWILIFFFFVYSSRLCTCDFVLSMRCVVSDVDVLPGSLFCPTQLFSFPRIKLKQEIVFNRLLALNISRSSFSLFFFQFGWDMYTLCFFCLVYSFLFVFFFLSAHFLQTHFDLKYNTMFLQLKKKSSE
jgi:hypothetical protein